MKNPDEIARFTVRLRELRKAKKMSQQELANEADIDKKTLQRIETGKMNPSLDILISIAKGLNMPLDALLSL